MAIESRRDYSTAKYKASASHAVVANAQYQIEPALASYYDYFYSAADAYIYISNIESDIKRSIEDIPFFSISYSINQTQKPIFGFWDRTPRAFIPGRSIVGGSFAIPHTYVGRLEEILMNADGAYGSSDQLNEKESLRTKYWGTRDWENVPEDPERSNFKSYQKKHLFYVHPVFDISIVYGIGDEVTYGDTGTNLEQMLDQRQSWSGTNDVNPLFQPDSYKNKPQRETISGIRLIGKSKSINVGGQPIVEEFSFMAREVIDEA